MPVVFAKESCVEMWRYVSKTIYQICVCSVPVPSDNLFYLFAGFDELHYVLPGISPIMHALFPSVSFSFQRRFTFCLSHFWYVPSLDSVFSGSSATLSIDSVIWIPFPSIELVSGVADIPMNEQRVFARNFVNGALPIYGNSIVQAIGLSAKTSCPAWN